MQTLREEKKKKKQTTQKEMLAKMCVPPPGALFRCNCQSRIFIHFAHQPFFTIKERHVFSLCLIVQHLDVNILEDVASKFSVQLQSNCTVKEKPSCVNKMRSWTYFCFSCLLSSPTAAFSSFSWLASCPARFSFFSGEISFLRS